MTGDVLTTTEDRQPGRHLLEPVMRAGRRLAAAPPLHTLREHAQAELATLHEALCALEQAEAYPVEVAEPLRRLAAEVDRRTGR